MRSLRRSFVIGSARAIVPAAMVAAAAALPTAVAAMPVFDASNYAQNLLIAARTLDQINNQIASLQNEATMLTDMARNLSRIDFPELEQLQDRLERIDSLIGKAKGLGFKVDGLDERLRQLFPDDFDRVLRTDQRVRDARARLDTSMDALRQTMAVQSEVLDNVRGDAEALSAIVGRSQQAEGALQAGQATNQLLALAAKQQFQLQQLMASQFRSVAVEQARRLQESREARAATRRFLGPGTAYTPH